MFTPLRCFTAFLFVVTVGLTTYVLWPEVPKVQPRSSLSFDSFGQRLKYQYIEDLAMRTYHRYQQVRETKKDSETYLMWDGRLQAARDRGLGDRFKGLSTAFYLALVLDRKFVPRFHGYNRIAPIRPITDDLEAYDVFPLFDSSEQVRSLDIWDAAFHDAPEAARRAASFAVEHEKSTFMRFTCNGEAGYNILHQLGHHYDFLMNVSPSDLFRIFAYLYLKRPGQRIIDHYNSLTVSHPILKSAALRVGVQLRVSEARQSMKDMLDCALSELVDACQSCNCAIFVTSDSEVATIHLTTQLRSEIGSSVFTSSLRPGHIGHVSIDEDLASWFDWYMLSIQDILFVSQSGFGLTAIKASTTASFAQSRNILGSCEAPHCIVRPASNCEFNNCLTRPDDVMTGWHRC